MNFYLNRLQDQRKYLYLIEQIVPQKHKINIRKKESLFFLRYTTVRNMFHNISEITVENST